MIENYGFQLAVTRTYLPNSSVSLVIIYQFSFYNFDTVVKPTNSLDTYSFDSLDRYQIYFFYINFYFSPYLLEQKNYFELHHKQNLVLVTLSVTQSSITLAPPHLF